MEELADPPSSVTMAWSERRGTTSTLLRATRTTAREVPSPWGSIWAQRATGGRAWASSSSRRRTGLCSSCCWVSLVPHGSHGSFPRRRARGV
uniref:Uncharacterized protein n=1 Tax=Arundo donax TaxID=35708 RepID=A0A0A8ZQ15_ARUDO